MNTKFILYNNPPDPNILPYFLESENTNTFKIKGIIAEFTNKDTDKLFPTAILNIVLVEYFSNLIILIIILNLLLLLLLLFIFLFIIPGNSS